MHKKERQAELLGVSVSTAVNRLQRDLIFDFISKAGEVCYRCHKPMTREDFSIEHKTAWMGSSNPVETFFDVDNIAYSHLSCNSKAAHDDKFRGHPSWYQLKQGCKCEECLSLRKEANS